MAWVWNTYSPRFAWGPAHTASFLVQSLLKYWTCFNTYFLQCFLTVFLQNPRKWYMFGHRVGPKHRFLQCCFNLFFKHNIIYAFFNIKLVQNTGFCSVFNTLTSQILWKHLCLQFFFPLLSVFPLPEASQVRFSVAGTPPKRPKIPSQYPSSDPTPKNRPKVTKTPAEEGFRCENFKRPPPAKADSATAILTNVTWAFSVAVCTPISTPSPPKRCGRILGCTLGACWVPRWSAVQRFNLLLRAP